MRVPRSPAPSVIEQLVKELSWSGGNITRYRTGGGGDENLLTAEVLQSLDFLPREAFLGAIIAALHGNNDTAREAFRREAERADFLVLPGEMFTQGDSQTRRQVQPDAIIKTDLLYCLVEAKRIRPSYFIPHQLAREFVMAHQDASGRIPILLLIVGSPPPIRVRGVGQLQIREAIINGLPDVFPPGVELSNWIEMIDETVFWITWQEIKDSVLAAAKAFDSRSASVSASISRLCNAIVQSVVRHS